MQVEEEPVVIQISLTGNSDDSQDGWVEGPLESEITASKSHAFVQGDTQILILSTSKGLRAYRNACAHQGLPLDSGLVDGDAGTITCPWHGFSFDMESGECFTAPQCQLEPFPLRIADGRIWVRPT